MSLLHLWHYRDLQHILWDPVTSFIQKHVQKMSQLQPPGHKQTRLWAGCPECPPDRRVPNVLWIENEIAMWHPDVLTTKPVVTRARPSEATVGSAMLLICGGHAFTNSLGPSGTLFDALTSHFSPAPRLNHTLPALLSEIGTHVLLHTLFLVPMLLSNHRRISSHLAYIRIYNWVYKYICAWRNMRSKMCKIP